MSPNRGAIAARVRTGLRSREASQTAIFTIASGLSSLLAGISRAVLASAISVTAMGAYSFGVSFMQFAALFFEFGLSLPASRMIAGASPQKRREIIGAAFLLYIPVGLAFVLTIFVLSLFVDSWFEVQAGAAIRTAAPLAFAFPFAWFSLQLVQGSDRLYIYSLTSFAVQLIFLAILVTIALLDLGLDASSALLLRSATLALAIVIVGVWLRPVFHRGRVYARQIIRHARDYGFQVYIGRVLSVGTFNMDVLILGALTDARTVAYYALALVFTQAAGLPVAGFASTLFPRMVREGHLARNWLAIGWAVGVAAVLGCWLLAGPVFDLVLPPPYAAATAFIVPLAIAQAIRGVTSIYNQYLSAQARGAELRNAGIVLTVSNVVLSFTMIPLWGATGAAWASVLALTANFIAHVRGYRRSVREGVAAAPLPTLD